MSERRIFRPLTLAARIALATRITRSQASPLPEIRSTPDVDCGGISVILPGFTGGFLGASKPITVAILGGGGRGGVVSDWCQRHPYAAKVVAVAEPLAERRQRIAERNQIAADMQFESWEQLLAKPKLADAVCNMLMDRLHLPAALKALGKGYHMLLEKPMATSLEDCTAIERAAVSSGKVVSVCHSMRYGPVYQEVKRLIDSGAIGDVVSFDQLEAVDPRHQSHSFVRGNWGNEGAASFMLLAKSCHDMDFLAWLIGKPCRKVSSFGTLSHFNKANCPDGRRRAARMGARMRRTASTQR